MDRTQVFINSSPKIGEVAAKPTEEYEDKFGVDGVLFFEGDNDLAREKELCTNYKIGG